MNNYFLIGFPKIQDFMEHERWNECIFCIEIEDHPVEGSTYAVPADLYYEVSGLANPKELLREVLNFIGTAISELGEDCNKDHIDYRLLKLINEL